MYLETSLWSRAFICRGGGAVFSTQNITSAVARCCASLPARDMFSTHESSALCSVLSCGSSVLVWSCQQFALAGWSSGLWNPPTVSLLIHFVDFRTAPASFQILIKAQCRYCLQAGSGGSRYSHAGFGLPPERLEQLTDECSRLILQKRVQLASARRSAIA